MTGEDIKVVAAIDRLTQVVDHHLAHIHDMLQAIADRLGDLTDQLEDRP